MTDWQHDLYEQRTRDKILRGEYITQEEIDKQREEFLKYNFDGEYIMKEQLINLIKPKYTNYSNMKEVLIDSVPLFWLATLAFTAIIILI